MTTVCTVPQVAATDGDIVIQVLFPVIHSEITSNTGATAVFEPPVRQQKHIL